MVQGNNVIIIVQARLTSNRFPNKVFANLKGKPVIQHVIDNLKGKGYPIIFAIPDTPENDMLETYLRDKQQNVFRGTEHDVLARFYQCATINKIDTIIRVCADTPMIYIDEIAENVRRFYLLGQKRMIYGNGSWVFNYKMLEEAFETQPHAESREHVVRSMFNSIDYRDDIERVEKLL